MTAIKSSRQFIAPQMPATTKISHRVLDFWVYLKVAINPDGNSDSCEETKSRFPKANAETKGGVNGINIRRTVIRLP